jgi:hypothetical protein
MFLFITGSFLTFSAMRARIFEDASVNGSLKGPLVGISAVPLGSLKEAIEALRAANGTLYFSLAAAVISALTAVASKLATGKYPTMTVDEAAAIYLYTMGTPLYRTLNTALRNEEAAAVAPFMPYIKLFLTALYKLPIEKCTVYRGIRNPPDFKKGDTVVWWGFSSSTRRVHVTHTFIAFSGPRTMFILENVPCVNIEGLSAYPGESERLLLPGTALKVLSVTTEFDNGRRDVQAQFVKSQVVFDFMHPQWPISLFKY